MEGDSVKWNLLLVGSNVGLLRLWFLTSMILIILWPSHEPSVNGVFFQQGEKKPNAHFGLGHFVFIPSLSLKKCGMHNCDTCNANNELLVIFLIKTL